MLSPGPAWAGPCVAAIEATRPASCASSRKRGRVAMS